MRADRPIRGFAVLVAFVLLAVGGPAAAAPIPEVGPAVDAGAAVVVDASGQALESGNSETPFTLRLPADAECPGDSENDQWRWQTFIVPEGTDLGTILYGGIGPEGPNQKSLYDTTSRYLSHQMLLPNQEAGEPGRLPTLPFMAFTGFPPAFFADGTYRIGVACTFLRQTERYWDARFVIENRAEGGGVAEFLWTAPISPSEVSAPPSDGSFDWRSVAWIVASVAALSAAFVLWRSARSPHHSEETP